MSLLRIMSSLLSMMMLVLSLSRCLSRWCLNVCLLVVCLCVLCGSCWYVDGIE